MSRDLEHQLNATAAQPSRPIDPAEISRLARKRRRRRHAGTAITGVAATVGLVTAVALPLATTGTDDTTTGPATDPAADVPAPVEDDDAVPYAAEFDCPVTRPPTPGFTPPEGYPAEPSDQAHAGPPGPDSEESVWYGSEDLWTVLPVDGPYIRRKSVWWSASFPGGTEEPQPEIQVHWERIDLRGTGRDRGATNAGGHGTNAHTAEDGWFMIAGIDPSDPGCWKVTATYKGAELSYVYEIPG